MSKLASMGKSVADHRYDMYGFREIPKMVCFNEGLCYHISTDTVLHHAFFFKCAVILKDLMRHVLTSGDALTSYPNIHCAGQG